MSSTREEAGVLRFLHGSHASLSWLWTVDNVAQESGPLLASTLYQAAPALLTVCAVGPEDGHVCLQGAKKVLLAAIGSCAPGIASI